MMSRSSAVVLPARTCLWVEGWEGMPSKKQRQPASSLVRKPSYKQILGPRQAFSKVVAPADVLTATS